MKVVDTFAEGDIVKTSTGELGIVTDHRIFCHTIEVETQYGFGLYAVWNIKKLKPQWLWRLFI